MRPDPHTLAATYRLRLMPKKRNITLVKKPGRKQGKAKVSIDLSKQGSSSDVSTDQDSSTRDQNDQQKSTGALYIGTSCWKIDEGAEDDSISNDEDYEDDLRLESTRTVHEDLAVQTYHTMCKALCVHPLKTFQNSLIKDTASVCHMILSPDDLKACATALVENHALRHIDLSHNNFRCKGGILIADGLAKNRFLKSLNLSWNHLRMDGAKALAESLLENSDLEELNIAWNGFHLRGCLALGHALKHNSSLVSLDLTCNRVSELCLAQLLKGIQENSTLQVLKLPLNPMSPKSAYSVLKFIEDHQQIALKYVDLGDQCVHEEFKTLLLELQAVKDLTVIYGPILRPGLSLDAAAAEKAEAELDAMMGENPLIVLMEFCRLQNLRLVDMFNTIDTDNSRSLSYDEFIDGLKRVNIPLSEDSLKMLLKFLDTDGDGHVDFR
ncbi:leucine-rich repeat-containing protein 74A [Aplysia californica]|uniref:Leucine-rich repeat-containing protein 74A n=1 Tax=Aplysia californica TaxID=6500 RepID=A0ABM0KA16_APLCA|nr:leucine-rich repeat-containing protein 74A [Aplysia californica]